MVQALLRSQQLFLRDDLGRLSGTYGLPMGLEKHPLSLI